VRPESGVVLTLGAMDAIGLLKQDHAAVKAMFDRYEALGEDAEVARQELADRIIKELSIHAAIEEQYLYPYAKQRDERLSRLVYEALEEHNVAKWELSAIEKLSPGDPRFDAKMAVLIESVRHHIREEEAELLPKLAELCERAELEALGDTLKHAKQAAPTHPHPRAPDEPPGNAMAPVLAAMDKGRDFASMTLERTGKLMGRLRAGAKALTRKAGKRTAKAAQALVSQQPRRRKTVARATAAKRRTARKSSSSRSHRKTVARHTAGKRRAAPQMKRKLAARKTAARKAIKRVNAAAKRAMKRTAYAARTGAKATQTGVKAGVTAAKRSAAHTKKR
jgi:Hemerythrin HHE cation binding domain